MAALGAVVQHYIVFPGFESAPRGIEAVMVAPGTYGFVALVLASGALELGPWKQDPAKEAGDFGDPVGLANKLGLDQYDKDMRNRELNNGRMGMFSAVGIIVAELVTKYDAMEQFRL